MGEWENHEEHRNIWTPFSASGSRLHVKVPMPCQEPSRGDIQFVKVLSDRHWTKKRFSPILFFFFFCPASFPFQTGVEENRQRYQVSLLSNLRLPLRLFGVVDNQKRRAWRLLQPQWGSNWSPRWIGHLKERNGISCQLSRPPFPTSELDVIPMGWWTWMARHRTEPKGHQTEPCNCAHLQGSGPIGQEL